MFCAIGCTHIVWAQPERAVVRTLECVANLSIPRYEPLARQARLSGNVVARVLIAGNGSVANVSVAGNAPRLLLDIVRRSIGESSYHPNCRNTITEILFDFKIIGEPTDQSSYERLSFTWPNRFTITAQPIVPIVD